MWELCSNPIRASAIMLHVSQALLYVFHRDGVVYLESFGILRFVDGAITVELSPAMQENLAEMSRQAEADSLCLIGRDLQKLRDWDHEQSRNSAGSAMGTAENLHAGSSPEPQ